MEAQQQITAAVRIAAAQNSATFLEPWLYADGAVANVKPTAIDVIDEFDQLETALSYPRTLYAVVSSATRTYGIVGNEKVGYEVADMLADNFPPGGPILRGYKTLASVVDYVRGIEGKTSFTLEVLGSAVKKEAVEVVGVKRLKTEAHQEPVAPAVAVVAPPAAVVAAAAEPEAPKPRKRAGAATGIAKVVPPP